MLILIQIISEENTYQQVERLSRAEKKLPGKEDLPIADSSCHEKEVFAERQQREIVGVATIHLVSHLSTLEIAKNY